MRSRSSGSLLIALVLTGAALSVALLLPNNSGDVSTFRLTNTLNFLICSMALIFGSRSGYSLFHVFFLYMLIFFTLAPALELASGTIYWGGSFRAFQQYDLVSFIALVSILLFIIVYYSQKFKARQIVRARQRSGSISDIRLLFVSATAAAIILHYNNYSLLSILFRGGEFTTRLEISQIQWLFFNYFVYPIPAITLVYYLIYSDRKYAPVSIALWVIFLMFNPLTGMARFLAAALYLAVFAAAFPSILRQKYIVTVTMLLGLFFIFPLMDIARLITAGTEWRVFDLDWLHAGHLDGFQSFAAVISRGEITWGQQLLGALLFFVPRQIWPDKPVGSGTAYAQEAGLLWDNIAMSYLAEGFVNFGIVGTFIFVIVLALASARFDSRFRIQPEGLKEYWRVYYLFALGLMFFLLRGDLMNSFGYSVGILASVWLVGFISLKRPNRFRF